MSPMQDAEEIRRYYKAILPFYDASLADRGDLPFWETIATRWGSKRILELGCGTGRVTEVLVRHAQVTAVDLLVEMLTRAARRAPAAQLVAADLRQFAFAERFDLIVLADDPMAHLISLDDRARALQLIADHLTPDGRVVIEGLYRSAGCTSAEETWSATGEPSVWNARYRFANGVEVATVMRSWSVPEVAGLRVENVWGDFDESGFATTSARMIIVAKR
jgi:SAM-dependent methyltransferase